MNKYLVAEEFEAVVTRKQRVPTTVMWNRLEGRPRRSDFSRALQAEVRDPLWMITRQWQLGEFIGDDAGSPVTAKVAWNTDSVTEVHLPDGSVHAYDQETPLEALIEAREIPLSLAGRIHQANLRLALGRRWRKMMVAAGFASRLGDFLGQYPFVAPDPASADDFPVTAHAAAWQTLAALAARAIDGGALFLHLSEPGALASDGLGLADPEKTQIDDLGTQFKDWAERRYLQPQSEFSEAWNARHLEYGLRLSAPRGERSAALAAPEYHGGRLDWFDFDAVAAEEGDGPGVARPPVVTSFMPATIQFEGMPNTRYWTFEEGATNFGDINPDTTDIAKLLLIEFGLVFANDWFLLPIELPVGSLTRIEGLAVTNVFGERLWIEPGVDLSGPVGSWRMFRLSDKGGTDGRLFLPATTPAGLESAPIDSVTCVRDEVSNMVWGIETTVQLPDGSSKRGREAALELHARYQSAIAPVAATPTIENDAKVQYQLMSSVAEHWIPFIPVHVDGDNREIQLRRAAMPRLLEGQEGVPPGKVAPRTRLLREGLDSEPPRLYHVAEEEIDRAGTVVETKWQRCRWLDGRVVTWMGHHRKTGRGEASSGLAFDFLKPKRPND